ncbi:hypothetical protein VIN01S_30760 [Vibrio inusitatus NBRC 102082]|uniref:Porin n=1 Tax=Vibrio inusitatus NBRC 102082 TaxID=1219070 RepID=A0A4Y3I076_9VIBR|nr:hypothetical protein [Vibrio inusitatus]GEA52272.1 hypothetical protein VIN01S_30760 [Vibrio inusitatus NBRC 102082]
MKFNLLTSSLFVGLVFNTLNAFAVETNDTQKIQDMSDPLAVYTQAGFGVTDKGLNVKVGRAYDTGNADTMAMNIIEVKGFAGETLGWSGSSERDDSIDTVRFRNFQVNKTNGRGNQIDMNYNVENQSLDASYSFIQALPKFAGLQLYPLVGVGARVQNGHFTGDQIDQVSDGGVDPEDQYIGYTIPGVYGVIGGYTKYSITDKLWLNYNPMWLTPIAGSDTWTDTDSVFTNEFVVSYQFTPRFNMRYFANWVHDQSYFEGDQRIEVNFQF